MIDFGSYGTDFTKKKGFTKKFYLHPDKSLIDVKSKEDRFQYELYSIVRTLQYMMLTN